MGLDSVEFVMALEDAFELAIPDAAARAMATPRHVINYLSTCVPMREGSACIAQHAFYRLRQLTRPELGLSRDVVRPSTPLAPLFPAGTRSAEWKAIQTRLGANHWPQIGRRRILERPLSPHVDTFAKLTEFCVARVPMAVKGPGERWTRTEIAQVVGALMREELGIERDSEDSRLVEDLGVD